MKKALLIGGLVVAAFVGLCGLTAVVGVMAEDNATKNPFVVTETAPTTTTAPTTAPAADGSLGAGIYEVGVTIQPGKWTTPGAAEGFGCYWQRSKDASGSFDAIIDNGNLEKGAPGILQVAATDKFVTFTGRCRWTKTG